MKGHYSLVPLLLWLLAFEPAFAFHCYQCESNTEIECSEKFDQENTKLKSSSCDDIFEARYCIKTTGIYAGEIGTKRFCSSRDYGDYCEFIQRKGDDRAYRSCVYTCSSSECNGSDVHFSSTYLNVLLISTLILVQLITSQ